MQSSELVKFGTMAMQVDFKPEIRELCMTHAESSKYDIGYHTHYLLHVHVQYCEAGSMCDNY